MNVRIVLPLLAALVLAALALRPMPARAQCLDVPPGAAWRDHPGANAPCTVLLMVDGAPRSGVTFAFSPQCTTDQGQAVAPAPGRPVCVGDTVSVGGNPCTVANIFDCAQFPALCR